MHKVVGCAYGDDLRFPFRLDEIPEDFQACAFSDSTLMCVVRYLTAKRLTSPNPLAAVTGFPHATAAV